MREVLCAAVYGDFKKKDVRLKVFTDNSRKRFSFQNTMWEAGYDCCLFSINDTDLEGLEIKKVGGD